MSSASKPVAYSGNDPYIFVSYSHLDTKEVYPFIEELQKKYNVWFDEGLHSGEEWDVRISSKLTGCAAFLFLMSDHSLSSKYCKGELNMAANRDKYFINVIMHKDIEQPPWFEMRYASYQYFNLYEHSSLAEAVLALSETSPKLQPTEIGAQTAGSQNAKRKPPEDHYIFISCQRRHTTKESDFLNALQKRYNIWYDHMPSLDYEKDDYDVRMEYCSAVLSVITTEFLRSKSCRCDLEAAASLNKPFIPVYLENIRSLPDWYVTATAKSKSLYLTDYSSYESAFDAFPAQFPELDPAEKGVVSAAYTGTDPFLFVSYDYRDRKTVYPFIAALQKSYNVWFDDKLYYGSDRPLDYEEMAEQCTAFLFMASPSAFSSKNCKCDLWFANRFKTPLLIVPTEDFAIVPEWFESKFSDSQTIPLFSYASPRDAVSFLSRKFPELRPASKIDEPAESQFPVSYTGNDPYVYVSYSHKDREKVYPFITELQKKYRVWFDEGLAFGTEWADEIAARILGCSAFLFMASEASLASKFCQDELYLARERNMPLLCIMTEQSIDYPDYFQLRYRRCPSVDISQFDSIREAIEEIAEKFPLLAPARIEDSPSGKK